MLDIWPTPATERDIALLDKRLRETPDNLFDPDLLTYPDKVKFLCARNGAPLVFLPVQNVLMLDSLGIQPGATPLEVAKSIEVLMKFIVGKALDMDYNELYFLCRERTTKEYAIRHGFEIMVSNDESGITLFRLKVRKLCGL